MKRSLLAIAGAAVLTAAGACAHNNGSEKTAVRVVTSSQDVSGCEKVSNLRLSGTWTAGLAKEELERLAQTKGGNTLLMGSDSNSGVAYRCNATP
jgi:hypothetical protein